MKALTLWRPWPVAIFFLQPKYRKDVENRGWKLPKRFVGERIAIHAGNRLDNQAFKQWIYIIEPYPSEVLDLLQKWRALSEIKGIIGTVVFGESIPMSRCDSRWASGPECWPIIDPIPLSEPIPCRGAQGLWEVPPDIAQQTTSATACTTCADN
jgi:hypothetical protein